MTIDLDALAANYRRVLAELGDVPAAGVVKADGYGLGVAEVAATLWAEGCRRFFVARVDEGIALRAAMAEAEILVFDGVPPGSAGELVAGGLVPVVNSLDQLASWRDAAEVAGRQLPTGLHIDTGMRRLGFPPDEYRALVAGPELLDGLRIDHVLSHLASADVSGSPQSPDQLERFGEIRRHLPMGTASLANSAGVFLGPAYHFGLVRPGISLYGGSPFPDSGCPNPMRQVVTLEAPIIQVRSVAAGDTIGYGATHSFPDAGRVATVPVGYADGFLRSASNRCSAAVAGKPVPLVGRVSMDLITIDVTGIDEHLVRPGAPVELLGPHCPVDEVATAAGSIPHELLTNLGSRYRKRYLGPPSVSASS